MSDDFDFDDILNNFDSQDTKEAEHSNLSTDNSFPPVEKKFEKEKHHAFETPAEHYKAIMSEGKKTSARLHNLFQKYTQTKDPKDKTLYRMQLINPFWEHFCAVAKGFASNPTDAKKYFLRFALLHPGLLSKENRDFFATIVDGSFQDQPVHYLDEWFRLVALNKVNASTTDEAPVRSKGNDSARMQASLDKLTGKIEGNKSILSGKCAERDTFEKSLLSITKNITRHNESDIVPFPESYTEEQKNGVIELQEIIKSLQKADREIAGLYKELASAMEETQEIMSKLEQENANSAEGESSSVDLAAVETEFGSIRQMAKMTVGRQGNAFPILVNDFYRCQPNTMGTKENVISILSWIESIDSAVYWRPYKNTQNRIVPYVVLIPSYGDFGICWEPYDKRNKATSRGRIAVPMYPKNITIAVLTAVADFRWQVAKEIASYYWMDEGLTGNYYQWFQAQKLKGDVKNFFIQDYILWLTKESEGTQKLPKEVRNTFWRYLPFPQTLKDKLKNRNLIYQELYQKDLNRAKSDSF
ncbi:MAG: hypothetical protein LBC53_00760 [Spirochaetaceae bacterium]|jgi:ferritin|nr:hypothetical protein [Spirochaetaceae bacterium]